MINDHWHSDGTSDGLKPYTIAHAISFHKANTHWILMSILVQHLNYTYCASDVNSIK